MKTLLLATALLLSANVSAKTYDQCKTVTSIAESVMKARQSGASLDQVMEVAVAQNMESDLTPIIMLAYDVPRYGTESYQAGAVNDFKSKILKVCMEIK
tara:strand:- start:183 stop:479 length:297 start_codon:yes stop_codon:yes gene_type:complete